MPFIYQKLHKKNSWKAEESGTHKHQQRRQGGDALLVAARRSEGPPEMEPPVAVEDDDMKVDGTKVSITPCVHFVTAAL